MKSKDDKIKIDVFNKFLEIKQDLINNLGEVFNRQHYYTHKYRGNILTDINVAVDTGPNNLKIVRIFVRHGGWWMRDILSYKDGEYYESNTTTNFYNEEK